MGPSKGIVNNYVVYLSKWIDHVCYGLVELLPTLDQCDCHVVLFGDLDCATVISPNIRILINGFS